MYTFDKMIARVLNSCDHTYMTRESFGKPLVVYKQDNQIFVSSVENGRFRCSIPFRPTDEDYFATDWEQWNGSILER